MRSFYSNLVQQLYVVNESIANASPTTLANVGDASFQVTGNGKYLLVFSVGLGGLVSSDLILPCNIEYVDITSPKQYASKLLKTTVDLTTTPIVVGEDYILRILVSPWISLSEKDSYLKDVAVHVTSAITTPTELADAFVEEFKKNFKRDIAVKDCFGIHNNGGKLEIYGLPQTDWKLGKVPVSDVRFTVTAGEIVSDGDEINFVADDKITTEYIGVDSLSKYRDLNGTEIDVPSNAGKKIADLEFFTLKERADIYGHVGYPYDNPSDTLVDPKTDYYVLNIHYSFIDGGTAYYKSEKDLTIVTPTEDAFDDLVGTIVELAPNAIIRNDGTI